jgi:ankyrin repeat protein
MKKRSPSCGGYSATRAREAGELATLLGQGLPPNLRNERGDSLLMLACYDGHIDAAQVLLAHGADPFRLDADGNAMLDAARKMGALDTMELLAAATNER